MFSRLLNLSERQRQDLEANPGPFLDMAYKRLQKAQRALEDARWILTGGPELISPCESMEIRSTASVMLERCNEALKIIDAALQDEPPSSLPPK
jgi:hypothetical protein